MPSGKTHIKINWIVLVLINVLIIAFSQDISINNFILFNIIFILTSYYISPDLDINSSVYKRWNILKVIWWPYREIMKHRQMSHSFIWGPISILVYLTIIILISTILLNEINFLPTIAFDTLYSDIYIIIIISIVLIVEIHILADKLL